MSTLPLLFCSCLWPVGKGPHLNCINSDHLEMVLTISNIRIDCDGIHVLPSSDLNCISVISLSFGFAILSVLTLANAPFPSLSKLLECDFLLSTPVSSESCPVSSTHALNVPARSSPQFWNRMQCQGHCRFRNRPRCYGFSSFPFCLNCFPLLSCLLLLMWVSQFNFLHKIQNNK